MFEVIYRKSVVLCQKAYADCVVIGYELFKKDLWTSIQV
jgi:hypothetical protein